MSDYDILEFLDAHELDEFEVGPTAIAVNVNLSEGTVWQRVRVLDPAGLIERTDEKRGYYTISPMGRRYLDGELTDDEKEHLENFDPEDI